MASLVEFDQRYARRNGDVFYSSTSNYSLCRGCGIAKGCKLQSAVEPFKNHENWKVQQVVNVCGAYVPVITFKDGTGWKGTANTFRRGSGWFNRVNVRDKVRLFSVNDGVFITDGIVVEKFQGPLGMMLDDHAHMNHLLSSELNMEAPGTLHRILATLYGRNYTGFDEVFSVIYVEVIDST